MMPDAKMEVPYEGAKEMILAEDVDNRTFLCQLVEEMWEELPVPKRKETEEPVRIRIRRRDLRCFCEHNSA